MTGRAVAAALAALALAPGTADAKALTLESSERLSDRLSALRFSTPALDFPGDVRVLLPSGYDEHPRRRYPVLYLFHGSFDTAASWTTKGDAEKITAGRPLIVVMPRAAGTGDGGGWASDWRNEGRGGPPRFETFTIHQLIPWIDAHYRTRARRGGRAVAGLSMGGFTAMSYAVRHPDLFAAAASFSGAVDTNNLGVQPVIQLETLADGGATPDAIWGPRATDEIVWRTHNPWDLAANLEAMTLSLRTGNGEPGPHDPGAVTTDPIEAACYDMTIALHQRLDALGIPHLLDDYGPGTHSWPYWQRDLRRELPRIMATFRDPPSRPRAFTHTSAEPRFSVYGWRVRREGAYAWTTLGDASRRGFELTGSGAATVVTGRLFAPRARVRVSAGERVKRLRADATGRLRLRVEAPARVRLRTPRA